MSEKIVRCVICNQEFTNAEITNSDCCPNCGCKGTPSVIKEDVTVRINWHELRIIACWAERWALQIEKSNPSSITMIDCICLRLQKQHPDKTPLTLRGEVEQLRKIYPNLKLVDDKGKDV